MNRRLLLAEFRRAFVPVVATTLACLVLLFVIEQILEQREPTASTSVAQAINTFVLVLLPAIGLFAGVRTFSVEVKERQLPFLETLPQSRGTTWAILVGANLGAVLAALGSCFLVRPSLLVLGSPEIDTLLAVHGLFIGFGAACCCALLFRRALAAIVLAVVCSAVVLAETSVLILPHDLMASLSNEGPSRWMFGLRGSSGLWAAVLLWFPLLGPLLSAWFLGLSLILFLRGEFLVSRVRLRNTIVVAVGLLGFIVAGRALLVPVFESHGYHSFQSFYPHFPYDRCDTRIGGDATLSSDRRFLCVVERLRANPSDGRLSIVDVGTGDLVQRIALTGGELLGWSDEREALLVGTRRYGLSRILTVVLGNEFRIHELRPGGRLLRRARVRGLEIDDSKVAPSGDLFVLIRQRGAGVILRVPADGGHVEPLVRAPLQSWGRLQRTSRGVVAHLINDPLPSRSWLLGAEARELKWDASSPRPAGRFTTYLWGERVFAGYEPALAEIRKVHAWNVGTTDSESQEGEAHYLFPMEIDARKHLFFLLRRGDRPDRGLLAAKRADEPTWSVLAETIGLGEVKIFRGYLIADTVVLDFDEGIAVYSEPAGQGYRIVLDDRVRNRHLEFLEYEIDEGAPPPTISDWSVDPEQLPDTRFYSITLHEVEGGGGSGRGATGLERGERRFFRYDLDSGELSPVSAAEVRDVDCRPDRPFRIQVTNSEFLRIDPDGSETRIWPH